MHDGTQVQETDNTDPGPSSGQHKSQEKCGDTFCPTSEAGGN